MCLQTVVFVVKYVIRTFRPAEKGTGVSIMKKYKTIRLLAAALLLAAILPAAAPAAEGETFTVSYGKGYYFENPLTGAEATGIFTGSIPPSATVASGGSVTVAENTIRFRDYEFVAWEYSYTVMEDGEEKTVKQRYNPGDTIENVTSDMVLQAIWKRPSELPLEIGGFLYYKKDDINVDGAEPNPVRYTTGHPLTVADCPFRKDGHEFTAWVDGDGRVYPAGSELTPDSVTVTLLPIWAKDNEAVVTHRVTYTTDEPGLTGELPASFELYEKTTFIVAENTQSKEGYAFSHWVDQNGNRCNPGDTYTCSGSETVLRAVWIRTDAQYTITPSCSAGGSISPNVPQTVQQGGTCVFVFLPDEGYEIRKVTVNGETVETSDSYMFENVSADAEIHVEFAAIGSTAPGGDVYRITLNCTDGGSAVLNGPPEVEEGGSRILTVTPDEGYTLTMITVNGLERTADAEGRLALDGILEDMTIEIAFERESGSNAVYYIMIAAIVLVFAAAGYFFYRKRA